MFFLLALWSAAPLGAELVDLTRDVWRFRMDDDPEVRSPGFDDSAWDRVSIPHTWNALDAQDGKSRLSEWNPSGYRRAPAWYRREVEIPESYKGQRTFLRGYGASLVADVFVNGKPVGSHSGAFTAFCFEITDHVKSGERALIAIRVDNSQRQKPADFGRQLEEGRKTVDIVPLRGDFNLYGGIYRGIELVTKPPVCISATDFASQGIYVTTPEVSNSRAVVRVESVISARGEPPGTATLTAELRDADGAVVAKAERQIEPKDGQREAVELEVKSPRFWNGIEDPHLYELEVSLATEGSSAVDVVTESIGIRSLTFDPQRGFVLNGKPLLLRGVNRHQDWQDCGWAIGPQEHEIDFAMIREMGSNAVRLAHYPQDPYVLNLCDRLGLLVIMELPLVGWVDPSEAFSNSAKTQLREMIHQHYNRPSVAMWGLWNELMNRAPEDMASPLPLVKELNAIAHNEDPTRPTNGAANESSSRAPGLRNITDLGSWNLYPGWYGDGTPGDMAKEMSEKRQMDGREMIGITEYGAGASIYQHEDWADLKKPEPRGNWHPEEYQAYCHEHFWPAIQAAEGVWGSFVWNMFDFAADHRDEGDRAGINDKGLVTHDRQIKKYAFYFYKASWTDEPVVHVTSRRFSPRPSGDATVKVYSNAAIVELSVGGRAMGPGHRDGVVHLWEKIPLDPGNVEIQATGKFSGGAVTDSITWEVKTPSDLPNPQT